MDLLRLQFQQPVSAEYVAQGEEEEQEDPEEAAEDEHAHNFAAVADVHEVIDDEYGFHAGDGKGQNDVNRSPQIDVSSGNGGKHEHQ